MRIEIKSIAFWNMKFPHFVSALEKTACPSRDAASRGSISLRSDMGPTSKYPKNKAEHCWAVFLSMIRFFDLAPIHRLFGGGDQGRGGGAVLRI